MKAALLPLALLVAACAAGPHHPRIEEPSAVMPSSTLAGTSWNVVAVNGRSTPRGNQYFIRFESSRLSAQFGCNGLSGAYTLNGDHLSVPSLQQTLMGCPEPAMTFENEGAAVLRSNVRIERPGDWTMRLVSETGSIDLELAR